MSHCCLAHLVVASFFFFAGLYLSDNMYCGLNPDTAKCCCVYLMGLEGTSGIMFLKINLIHIKFTCCNSEYHDRNELWDVMNLE